MNSNEMIPAPMSELIHFLFTNGKQASIITYEINLAEEIDAGALCTALKTTLQHFPHFCLRPVIKDNKLFFVMNTKEPVILKDDGKPVCLCEDDVHDYMFAIAVKGDRIRARFHHGLSDGRGCCVFLKALLYYYYTGKGEEIPVDENFRIEEEKDSYVAYFEQHMESEAEPFGMFKQTEDMKIFQRPEPPLEDPAQGHLYEMTCPIQSVLSFAKRADSTPVPMVSVILAQAYRQVYDVGDQIVMGGSAVDYRVIFKDKAVNNAAGSVVLPYLPKMEKLDLATQVTAMRTRLDIGLQKENIIADNHSFAEILQHFASIPAPMKMLPGIIAPKIQGSGARTCMVSYVGGVRFPEALQKHIKRMAVYYVPFLLPVYVMGIENNGVLHITFLQRCESDALVKKFYQLLKEQIPDTQFTDCGLQTFDSFYLDHMPEE